jgi:ribose 5-phosphate isomerase A
MTKQNQQKKAAAEKAVDYIKPGTVVGLGTGSTVQFALEKIARLLEEKKLYNIIGISTSKATESAARKFNIPTAAFSEKPNIDLTIDGADEVDPQLNLIKGGGGALLREKIIAQASKELIIIIDEGKYSEQLGTNWAVPVEVIPFAAESEKIFLQSFGADVKFRMEEDLKFITDEGNWILDCNFGKIKDPAKLSFVLNSRAGIVEHGLFIGLAGKVIIAGENGIRELEKD